MIELNVEEKDRQTDMLHIPRDEGRLIRFYSFTILLNTTRLNIKL